LTSEKSLRSIVCVRFMWVTAYLELTISWSHGMLVGIRE